MGGIARLTAVLLLAASQFAFAEGFGRLTLVEKNFRIDAYEFADHQVVELFGALLGRDGGRANKILKSLTPNKDIVLKLNFGGGFDRAVAAVVKTLHQKCNERNGCRITTMIPSGAVCASYCIPLYMLGYHRIAYVDSRFGFHTAALFVGKVALRGEAERQYRISGVSEEWLIKNREFFERHEITWQVPMQLTDSNIVTHVLDRSGRLLWTQFEQ